MEDVVPVRACGAGMRRERARGLIDEADLVDRPSRDGGGGGQDDGREEATPESAHDDFAFRKCGAWTDDGPHRGVPPPAVRRDRGLAGPRVGALRALRAERLAGVGPVAATSGRPLGPLVRTDLHDDLLSVRQ
jgi:hypothetical protein